MPEALSYYILVPIPKGQKDPTKSNNYCPVALTTTLSKVIEQAIILQYSEFSLLVIFSLDSRKVSLLCYVLAYLRMQCLAISIGGGGVYSFWLIS